MHHRCTDSCAAAGKSRIHPGKIIFYAGVFLPPGRLITDRGRPIPLGLPFHGHKGQMGTADGNAQSCLPVALQLMPFKVEIPVGHSIKLTEHPFSSVLACHADRLLDGGILRIPAEDIHSRKLLVPVTAHGLTQAQCLGIQSGFRHVMPCHSDMMGFTPGGNRIGIGGYEALRQMVMILITMEGGLPVRKLPQKLRQHPQKVYPIGLFIGSRQIISKGKGYIILAFPIRQYHTSLNLGFVRKNGRDGSAEFLSQHFIITFMGDFQKPQHGFPVHHIHIGLVIVPGAFLHQFHIGKPQLSFPVFFFPAVIFRQGTFYLPIRLKETVLRLYPVSGQIITRRLFPPGRRFQEFLPAAAHTCLFLPGEQQMPGPVIPVFRHHSPRIPGRITVLIIKPAEHPSFFGLFVRIGNKLHEFLSQIFCIQARPGMQMGSPEAHLLKDFHLAADQFPGNLTVPGPEGGSPVFTCRIPE